MAKRRRQGKQWAEADVKDNARITERVWRLVRAGRMAEAQELCMRCGQPWRAASLGGSLGPGPTPLGVAAVHVSRSASTHHYLKSAHACFKHEPQSAA